MNTNCAGSKREAGLRAERSAIGARKSHWVAQHWSGLERSDKIKELRRK